MSRLSTPRWPLWSAPIALIPAGLSLVAFTAPSDSVPAAPVAEPVPAHVITSAALDDLEARARRVEHGLERAETWYGERVAHVERVLRPFHEDSAWVRRVSVALVRAADDVDLDPRALASVVLVENPWLDPEARSPVGAVGLMQVMPLHRGNWSCGPGDLAELETNLCYGSRIFASLLGRFDGDLDRALLAYNGCVNGTNTPDCHLYPTHVYSRAGRAAMQRWLSVLD